jgi:hypothetical protein
MSANISNNIQNGQHPSQTKSAIWFSHREKKFNAIKLLGKRIFKWSGNSKMWNWDNCFVSAVKREDGKIRIIVRSFQLINSKYRKRKVNLKFMLGFDISQIGELKEDEYEEPISNRKNKRGNRLPRWYLELDEDHYIWQWKEKDKAIEDSQLARYRRDLKNVEAQPYSATKSNIFNPTAQDDGNRIIPVIYQPAIDSWKNFLREVHCFKMDDDTIQVTLLFDNEHLTKHKPLDQIYRFLRLLLYGRIADLESYTIKLQEGIPRNFQFFKIYSGDKTIADDDVHLDVPINDIVPSHQINYYFINEKHPIVFVNTANHAMSDHDTNHKIWKWEYTPWEDDSPVRLGDKSREQLESARWEIFSRKWLEQNQHNKMVQ